MVEVIVRMPESLAKEIGEADEIPIRLLEAYAAEAYRAERLSRFQVGQLLGMDRWQTEQFLAERAAQRPYTLEDWALDRESLTSLAKS